MPQTFRHFIDGRFVESVSGERLSVFEPATGESYAEVAAGGAEDVDGAVSAAARAFPAWSRMPAADRSRLLVALADRVEAERERFAHAESVDAGKPIRFAETVDIPRAVLNLRHFGTAILHRADEAHVTDDVALNVTLRRPRGVAGVISPWNLPLYLLTWKIAPALATGNTVVAKPSELTPATATMLCEAAERVGFPPGVLNVVHGEGRSAGAALVRHDDVPTLSFTGGTLTGRSIAGIAGPAFKRYALEMGGKNATVVFADADLDDAVETSVRASFANQGQICLCGSRILVERGVYETFVERFVALASRLRPGDPDDRDTEQGALISEAHLGKVAGYVALARDEGGEVILGGEPGDPPNARCARGWFYRPTVLVGLGPDCRTNTEEIFGPVVSVAPFEDEDEAVAIANGTPYGLAGSLWTSDLDRAHRMADRLDCGTLWVNCWLLRDLRVPFGGFKQSGVGREGGNEALRFFTEPQNVCIRTRRSAG